MDINGVEYSFEEVLRDGPVEPFGAMIADGSYIVIHPDKTVLCVEFDGTTHVVPEHLH